MYGKPRCASLLEIFLFGSGAVSVSVAVWCDLGGTIYRFDSSLVLRQVEYDSSSRDGIEFAPFVCLASDLLCFWSLLFLYFLIFPYTGPYCPLQKFPRSSRREPRAQRGRRPAIGLPSRSPCSAIIIIIIGAPGRKSRTCTNCSS